MPGSSSDKRNLKTCERLDPAVFEAGSPPCPGSGATKSPSAGLVSLEHKSSLGQALSSVNRWNEGPDVSLLCVCGHVHVPDGCGMAHLNAAALHATRGSGACPHYQNPRQPPPSGSGKVTLTLRYTALQPYLCPKSSWSCSWDQGADPNGPTAGGTQGPLSQSPASVWWGLHTAVI